MVVMDPLPTEPTEVRQERTGLPSSRTVQAPQAPIPQPYFVPFRSSVSRSAHSSGVSGGRSTVLTTLLIFSFRGIRLPLFARSCTGSGGPYGNSLHALDDGM